MKIEFSPVRSEVQLEAHVSGDTLTINGEDFDFSALGEGEVMAKEDTNCDLIVSDVVRTSGVINITLLLPHGALAPDETRFPESVSVSEGVVPLPPRGDTNEMETEDV